MAGGDWPPTASAKSFGPNSEVEAVLGVATSPTSELPPRFRGSRVRNHEKRPNLPASIEAIWGIVPLSRKRRAQMSLRAVLLMTWIKHLEHHVG